MKKHIHWKIELDRFEFFTCVVVLFLAVIAAIKFVLMKMGLTSYVDITSIGFGTVFSALVCHEFKNDIRKWTPSKFTWYALIPPLFVFIYLIKIYADGVMLPAHDPIAVPTFASILAKGIPLYEYYSPGDSGYAYPPSFPLLLSFVYLFTHDVGVLLVFKVVNITAVGLIPLTWAWMTKRIFKIQIPLYIMSGAFYIAAFGLERTLNYTLPFAGKNSQLLLAFIFPVFIIYVNASIQRGMKATISAGFLFFGLIMLHYSALHLAAAVLIPIFAYFLLSKKCGFEPVMRAVLIGLIGLILFIVLWREALSDPRASIAPTYLFKSSLKAFLIIFLSPEASPLAIFNPQNSQSIGSPMRGYLLLISIAFAAGVARALRFSDSRNISYQLFLAATCFFFSVVIAMVFGSGLLPTGANIDFARWFIFPLQIGVFSCALLSMIVLIKSFKDKITTFFFSFLLIIPLIIFISDTSKIRKTVSSSVVSASQIISLKQALVPGRDGCIVIASNITAVEGFSYIQIYRPLEYVEMVTQCKLVNGSWVHGPLKGWGIKPGHIQKNIFPNGLDGMAVYIVGDYKDFESYSFGMHWESLPFLKGEPIKIWRLKI